MAFTFNWSPLTADADFYRRARDLLTKALNKSPKPPIIVDDILVSELNLGTVPPDLEILEIGDLANDRFRGIFKMCYSGNAFLTLKTRVQANPLNTYLYSKPAFTSPQPLAAASGLTIPLSITLSEIKLSAFIILVFSRQKGLTLVFRNDPLESLKVSSTFDSIQFVRDYLQRTIEQRLRNLMMDELPAIIHRLSLQLWCPDQANKDSCTPQEEEVDEKGVDPFASPPLDPVDANGNLLDLNAISEITLNGGGEAQPYFSQQSLLRLAGLTDSHRSLALFTPAIRDVVFRAWSACADRSEAPTPAYSSITRTYSFPIVANNTKTFSDPGCASFAAVPTRPNLISLNSLPNMITHGANHSARPGRKKKNRVVNLRRKRSEVASNDSTPDTGSETESVHLSSYKAASFASIPEESGASIAQPANAFAEPSTPTMTDDGHFSPKRETYRTVMDPSDIVATVPVGEARSKVASPVRAYTSGKSAAVVPGEVLSAKDPSGGSSDTSSVILEQAWIMRMASEIARRMYDEKKRHQQGIWAEAEHPPPPAYEAAMP